jgi:hypothetical protein
MKLRKCSKCGIEKPLKTSFYRDKKYKDGHKKICKDCLRTYFRQWGANNPDRIRGYGRKWRRTEAGRLNLIARVRKYRRNPKNRQKLLARGAISQAVFRGKIVKPSTCSLCGRRVANRSLHAHHVNYKDKFGVIWVCSSSRGKNPSCHTLIEGLFDDAGSKIVSFCSEGRNTPGTAACP